ARVSLAPAFLAEERDEYTADSGGFHEPIAVTRNDDQPLLLWRTDGNDKAATVARQLLLERLGRARRARGDQDPVERRMRRAAERSVADRDLDIRIAER